MKSRAQSAAEAVLEDAQALELKCIQLADRCVDSRTALRLRKLALALISHQEELARSVVGGS